MRADLVNSLVRPLGAIVIFLSLCVAFLSQVFGLTDMDIKDAFLSLGGGIVGWYFGKRESNSERADVATQAAEKAVELQKASS